MYTTSAKLRMTGVMYLVFLKMKLLVIGSVHGRMRRLCCQVKIDYEASLKKSSELSHRLDLWIEAFLEL